ncbi:MAG: FtsX-like permease family protein [Alphaproteobacteria bacterium]|nr:FtsX-like permease family protein [Alphaproteobacteria bacterium]
MNVMLVSVAERRLEIGIRRALGARRRDIQSQFLTEAVILSLCGGVVGIALGIGVAWAISTYSGWTFHVATNAVALGAGTASGVGVLFGYVPAYQAARLDTIAVLRGH